MQTFFLLGRYTTAALSDAEPERTDEIVGIIEDLNGQIQSIHAVLGLYDIIIIVNLPDNPTAMRASLEMARTTGIQFCTLPAISVNRFDELLDPPPDVSRAPEFQVPPGAPEFQVPPGIDLN